MLVEMDGFEGGEGVIGGRPPQPIRHGQALLRRGPSRPSGHGGPTDIKDATNLLKVRLRKVPLHDNVRADVLARF